MPAFRLTFIVLLLITAVCSAQRVEITGASALAEPKLREAIAEQLQDIESRGLTPARADDAAFYLASHYRNQGYSRAAVDYEIRGGKVILKISEGPRTLLRSLKFVGNRSVSSEILAPFFAGVPIAGIADAQLPYHAADVIAGGDRVRGYYVSEGWLDATVTTTSTRVSADGTAADIEVTIVEGSRYQFGALTLTGETPYSRAELIEALGAKPEGAFNSSLVDAMQGTLRSWLRARGYFAAEVVAVADPLLAKNHVISVSVDIRIGPKFRVGGVVSRGLDRVKPEFIQQRFRKVTATTYNPALIDEKYRELLRTGLFRTLRVSPVKTGAETLTIELEAEEAKQKHFGFEVGYGSYDGVVAVIQGGDRNFLRTGRPITIELHSSMRGFEGEILHVDPWFLESEWALRTRLSSKFRDEEGYTRKGAGVRIDATRKLTPRLEVSAFTEFAITNITANGIDATLLGPLDYTLTSIGIAQKLDHRDDPLNPRRGFVFSTSLELDALNGELAFGRALFRYSHYRSMGRSLLAAGVRAGWIIPAGGAEDIPIDLRYFNGGGGTVRSFAERDLGPKDENGNSLGGSFFAIANLEWDFPITDAFGGALFADAGNLRSEASPGLEDFRIGLGVGVRYNLPIGPMRLDYGYNPSPRAGEDTGAVHFSFGFAF